jgi:hypothetical protein
MMSRDLRKKERRIDCGRGYSNKEEEACRLLPAYIVQVDSMFSGKVGTPDNFPSLVRCHVSGSDGLESKISQIFPREKEHLIHAAFFSPNGQQQVMCRLTKQTYQYEVH